MRHATFLLNSSIWRRALSDNLSKQPSGCVRMRQIASTDSSLPRRFLITVLRKGPSASGVLCNAALRARAVSSSCHSWSGCARQARTPQDHVEHRIHLAAQNLLGVSAAHNESRHCYCGEPVWSMSVCVRITGQARAACRMPPGTCLDRGQCSHC